MNLLPRTAALLFPVILGAQQPCEKLTDLKLPHIEIQSAALAPAGKMPADFGVGPPVEAPARCVVKAISRPTSDSEIKLEVWLPTSNWNGRYLQAGNGGWAGVIPVSALANAVQRGYATAGTDDGHGPTHPSGPAGWAIGHPEKLIDFGHRAIHETSETAKAVIRAFYGNDPKRNYFMGCSDGGREALMEAQRYPEDFHGIVAGAPANDWSNLFTGFVWNERALHEEPASMISPALLPVIHKAALAACDANDGVKDALLEDPRTCHFNPEVLLCKGADRSDCLSEAQAAALKKIYAGPVNPRTGKQIFPGYPPGHEAIPGSWQFWIVSRPGSATAQASFGNSFYGQAVFEDPKWDFRTLDFDSDVAFAAEKAGAVLNSTNPDLRSFRAHGGKLIQYHGWADGAISPLSSIDYYTKVQAFLAKYPDARHKGGEILEFYRLFMVPGMGHCGGGLGPNSFGNDGNQFAGDPNRDVLSALVRWVEEGKAPERIIGTGAVAGDSSKPLTRPLCPFPQTARYNGSGDPNQATSYTCAKE